MKVRVRDIVWTVLAAIAFVIGGWTIVSNLGQSDVPSDQQLMTWYLTLNTVMLLLIAVIAVIVSWSHGKLPTLKKALFSIEMVLSLGYVVLVLLDALPLLTKFIAEELWRTAVAWLPMSIYIIYLLVGLLMLLLCYDALRGGEQKQRALVISLIVLLALSTMPTVITLFQYNISDSLRGEMAFKLILTMVIQALPVYPAFCNDREA